MKSIIKNINYWLTYGTCHSLRILTWLPYRWQMLLGNALGKFAYLFATKARHIATTNIQLCFPNLNKAMQKSLVQECFGSLGMGAFESLLAAFGDQRKFKSLNINIKGLDAVEEAIHSGIGAIILFPHFVPMYLIGRLTRDISKLPISLMYHAPKNKALNDFFLFNLERYCPTVFNRKHANRMIKYLRQGNIVWYAPDLDIGKKHSLFVPFFNHPAATLTATLRIAALSQAKVFPIQFYRQDKLTGYDINILPALNNFPSDDPYQDLTQINQLIEEFIKLKPEQYLWIYKRFSSRPEGQTKFY